MNGTEHLGFLASRRSTRAFTGEPIAREVLRRLVEAATWAPSATNRQPWRFAVVTAPELREAIAAAVREKTEAMDAVAQRGHHSGELTAYWRFFWEPLQAAAALVVPYYRQQADLLAGLIEAGGGDPRQFVTAEPMQAELQAASAATMALLLQAHAEGLGACWMTGPLVAREEIGRLLGIGDPWRPAALVALGHPAEQARTPSRKPIDQVAKWFDAAPNPTEQR
jgi:nitroreductase